MERWGKKQERLRNLSKLPQPVSSRAGHLITASQYCENHLLTEGIFLWVPSKGIYLTWGTVCLISDSFYPPWVSNYCLQTSHPWLEGWKMHNLYRGQCATFHQNYTHTQTLWPSSSIPKYLSYRYTLTCTKWPTYKDICCSSVYNSKRIEEI